MGPSVEALVASDVSAARSDFGSPARSEVDDPLAAPAEPAVVGAALRGRVIDERGGALEGVGVWVGRQHEAWSAASEVKRAQSGANGEFEVRGEWSEATPLVLAFDSADHVITELRDITWRTAGVQLDAVRLARGASVSGWVSDEQGAAVGDARVRFDAAAEDAMGMGHALLVMQTGGAFGLSRVARSAADGSFELRGLWRTRGHAVAHAAGFVEAVSDRLDLAQSRSGVRLTLLPGTAVRGEVRLDDQPVVGAVVRLRGARALDQGRITHSSIERAEWTAVTDERGEWVATGVADGQHKLEIRAEGCVPHRETITAPTRVALRADLQRAGSIELTVLGGGQAQADVVVQRTDVPEDALELNGVACDTVRRVTGLNPGEYRASAGSSTSEFVVRAGESVVVLLDLAKDGLVRGVVLAARTGLAVEGARVWLASESMLDPTGRPESLPGMFLEQLAANVCPPNAVATGAKGEFALAAPEPGRYVARVHHPAFATATTAPFDARAPGADGLRVELDLGATLRGRVETSAGRGVALERVVARMLPDGMLVWRSTADADGAFELPRIPPGTLEVALEPRRESGSTQSIVDPFAVGQPVVVHVTADGGPFVVLVRDPPSSLVGRVVGSAEQLQRLRVLFWSERASSAEESSGVLRWTAPTADGEFRFDQLDAGGYLLEVVGAGACPLVRRVEVLPASVAHVSVDLPQATLRCRVTGADGASIVGAEVHELPVGASLPRATNELLDALVFEPPLPAGWLAEFGERGPLARTDSQGNFHVLFERGTTLRLEIRSTDGRRAIRQVGPSDVEADKPVEIVVEDRK